MIVAMATRHPGDPDQARRPPPQHAHARRAAEAEADREGQGDARDLRAARPPARHPRDQVGARGSRLRDLHPRKYKEIKELVASSATERERYVDQAGACSSRELRRRSGSRLQISGRAKHFYSIYSKMPTKGREFNEIYDLTAMRVIVDASEGLLRRRRRRAHRSGSRCRAASRTTSRCPSSTCTSRCTRR